MSAGGGSTQCIHSILFIRSVSMGYQPTPGITTNHGVLLTQTQDIRVLSLRVFFDLREGGEAGEAVSPSAFRVKMK